MNGKIPALVIVMIALVAGIAVYYLQEYAYYEKVRFEQGAEILLTPIISDRPEPILAENVQGIDATSSPLRFRACFQTPLTQAMLTETYRTYEHPVPLLAPSWFDCFDANAIGEALERGEALAFLSQAGIRPSVDRVIAVFPDGRAYAWHQLAPDTKEGSE